MAPVIFKVKFYSNSKSKTMNQNIAHVNYIATRPGVDKSEDFQELDEEFIDLDNAEAHVKYMSERPRSHGLFDNEDRVIDLSDIKNELKEHKGIVWRSVLSLKEEDAVKLGYVNREQWQETLRSYMPEAVKTMGIQETNLRWIAAFHQEKGHPHCHIMFWEKDTKRTRGKLGKWEINNMKKVFVKGLYEKERSRLYVEKTAKRDLIRDLAKNDLTKVVDLIRETKKENIDVKIFGENKDGIVQKLWTDKERELSKHIFRLSKIMPSKGRIALKYMPENVKKEVGEISDWILRQSGFSNNLDIIKKDAVELASQYTEDIRELSKAQDKAYVDIRNRVSQVVLKAAVESNFEENVFIDKDKSDIAIKYLKNGNLSNDIKGNEKETIRDMGKILFDVGMTKQEVNFFIKEFKEKNNLNIEYEEVKKIVDKAYKESEENVKWNRYERMSNSRWNKLFKNLGYKENEIPKNMYLNSREKREYQNNNITNMACKAWKGAWRALEREKYREEIKAQKIKKQLNRNRENYEERE
ncbi:MAG: relaxase MobL [Clostridium tyrobutyricum]|jgi:hypothetical protein|uniref:MobP3 family relaxase n=1 Tax=Clostridium tyrobutyricum TaxID=1519 RepID=UPI00242ABBC5|nr:MobP3 family relaxase [Clostridium tyrobutyricum]MCH4200158.1 relaxase MobL [Clostridium tyrobutyricum]MCH4237908.1 relaxase MobL [Clostridium tyrobutyricum]MCH4259726.1 relaxase MobL [Clostridium tyrobutyricum]